MMKDDYGLHWNMNEGLAVLERERREERREGGREREEGILNN